MRYVASEATEALFFKSVGCLSYKMDNTSVVKSVIATIAYIAS